MSENESMAPGYYVEWDMGTYGPFADEFEAKAYQRTHRMTGSSVDRY